MSFFFELYLCQLIVLLLARDNYKCEHVLFDNYNICVDDT